MKPAHIFWIAPYFPFPPDSGAKVRIAGLIRHISNQYRISLIGMYEEHRDCAPSSQDIVQAKRYFQTVRIFVRKFPYRGGVFSKLLYALFSPHPLYVVNYRIKGLREEVQKIIKEEGCDIIQADEIYTAQYLFSLNRVKRVLILHNVDSLIFWRYFLHQANIFRKVFFLIQFFKMRRYEKKIIPKVDLTLCVSETDRKIFEKMFKEKVRIKVIPNGVDTEEIQSLPHSEKPVLIFIGIMNYQANVEAVESFLKKTYPLILEEIPNTFFYVVGANPSEKLINWEEKYPVKFTGCVDNLIDWYKRAGVVIVPLKIGSGTRLKILEAMAYGRPVVSTTLDAEGLEVTDGENILIADSPKEFAEKVVTLLKNSALYGKIIKNARNLVEEKYNWKGIAKRLAEEYQTMLRD